jgi:hypothetical protein
MNSVLQEFLLFEFENWIRYGNMILNVCQHALYPVFVFALILDKASERPQPMSIFKRLIVAQLILLVIPTHYKSVAGFGFEVGDSILSEQRIGLLANWNKFKKKAEKKAKRSKKKSGFTNTVGALFLLDGTDVVEKGAALLILICVLIIKVIYSVVYYATYCTSGMLAVLSIFPPFKGYLAGVLKSILYLIVSAIIVAFVLAFLNDTLAFTASEEGFIENLTGIAKFLVLCFVLLGSLKISQSIVNGSGAEGWAANMGSMIGAGLAYKSLGAASSIGKTASSGIAKLGASTAGMAANPIVGAAIGAGYMATKPISAIAKTIGSGLKTSLANTTENIQEKYKMAPVNNEEAPNKAGTNYSTAFNKVANSGGQGGGHNLSSSLNPINHAKASMLVAKGSMQVAKDAPNKMATMAANKMGMPIYSKHMSIGEKAVFAANNKINSIKGLSREEQIKNMVIGNKISKTMGGA